MSCFCWLTFSFMHAQCYSCIISIWSHAKESHVQVLWRILTFIENFGGIDWQWEMWNIARVGHPLVTRCRSCCHSDSHFAAALRHLNILFDPLGIIGLSVFSVKLPFTVKGWSSTLLVPQPLNFLNHHTVQVIKLLYTATIYCFII